MRENVRVRTGQLESGQVSIPGFGDRRFRLYRPPEATDDRERPLLLMFDGQNIFDDEGSFSGGWYADRAVERLSRRRLRPFIVGLDHGGETRINELSPYPTRFGDGRADDLLEWIGGKWLPRLRGELPLIGGPVGVLLAGSSMGGLAAFYGHIRFPEVFGGALAMSASFGIGGKRLFDLARRMTKPSISQIYLDSGLREPHGAVEQMAQILRERGYRRDLLVRLDKNGGHNEASWRRRLPAALRFFYR